MRKERRKLKQIIKLSTCGTIKIYDSVGYSSHFIATCLGRHIEGSHPKQVAITVFTMLRTLTHPPACILCVIGSRSALLRCASA